MTLGVASGGVVHQPRRICADIRRLLVDMFLFCFHGFCKDTQNFSTVQALG